MLESIQVRRLSAGSVFKLLGVGLVASLVPLGAVLGVLSLFGLGSVSWMGRPLTGWAALVAAPFIGLSSALVFTAVLGAATCAGLWLYAQFAPLTLRFTAAAPAGAPARPAP